MKDYLVSKDSSQARLFFFLEEEQRALLWRVGLENREEIREPNLSDALKRQGVTTCITSNVNFFFFVKC